MRRIFFIVLWVFTFAFLACVASLIIAIGFDMIGLHSWSDFLMDKLLIFIIWAAPITGLTLGLLGHLPGTKEKKSNQKFFCATKSAFVDLRIRLAFIPFIGHWFAPDEKGDDKRDDA